MNIPPELVKQIDNTINKLKGWKWDFGTTETEILKTFYTYLYDLELLTDAIEKHLAKPLSAEELKQYAERLRKQSKELPPGV